MEIKPGKLLESINSPEDLKKIDRAKLTQLSEELRNFIIDSVSVYGGHFCLEFGCS